MTYSLVIVYTIILTCLLALVQPKVTLSVILKLYVRVRSLMKRLEAFDRDNRVENERLRHAIKAKACLSLKTRKPGTPLSPRCWLDRSAHSTVQEQDRPQWRAA